MQVEAAQAYGPFQKFAFSAGRVQSSISFHNQIAHEASEH